MLENHWEIIGKMVGKALEIQTGEKICHPKTCFYLCTVERQQVLSILKTRDQIDKKKVRSLQEDLQYHPY